MNSPFFQNIDHSETLVDSPVFFNNSQWNFDGFTIIFFSKKKLGNSKSDQIWPNLTKFDQN